MLTFNDKKYIHGFGKSKGGHMTTSQLIEQYFDIHAGKSSYIDQQLRLAEQAAIDAARCLERNEPEYAVANLAIARSLINALADTLMLYPSQICNELITIFHAANNELTDLNDAANKALES